MQDRQRNREIDIAAIRSQLGTLPEDKSELGDQIDALESYIQQRESTINAQEKKLINAHRQINDLISLLDDKVRIIKQLKSRIEWIHNKPAYKIYSKITSFLKSLKRN
jgi:chromosome segregation ATPase